MRILLINPPHPAIGSRIPREQLPPLGLLSIGGPLIDAGHEVSLLDGEFGPMALATIVSEAVRRKPEAVLLGHSGSTSAHPVVAELTRLLRRAMPEVWIVYGGVFPSYHWSEVLAEEPQIDVVVRGEGEDTAPRLLYALENGGPLAEVGKKPGTMGRRPARFLDMPQDVRRNPGDVTIADPRHRWSPGVLLSLSAVEGIAFRDHTDTPVATPLATMIRELDEYRVGWELVDLKRYSYWGGKRAVVVQFSRGCPHLCTYCGQRGFWTRWRHRDPKRFAAELAWLHRVHGVELINFADENPTADRAAWKEFLEALIAEDVPLILIGSTRADDIVRDADLLHLYKRAGVLRFLLGIENYDEATLAKVRKGGTPLKDREAIRLLREHGIISLATWVVGFAEETIADYRHGLRQLLAYDPDQIQLLYATPHRWTPFFREVAERKVIQTDRRTWDYKHQVLETKRLRPWQVLILVKLLEVAMQLRPRALWRALAHPDQLVREGMRWYYRMGRRVWFHEVFGFFIREHRTNDGPTVEVFWGQPQDHEEQGNARRPVLAKAG